MIGYPAPLQRGVRSRNHDRGCDRRDGWVGLSSCPERLAASPGWKAQTTHESEMALFYECMERCAHIVLDIADIVRDGDLLTVTVAINMRRRNVGAGSAKFQVG